jgi:mRNA-degrading endonuclease toxin of MazEF toxin-antitoxin module
VQRDAGNLSANYGNTTVVAISTRGRDQFSHVEIQPDDENGLSKVCYVKCEHILTVSKGRLVERIGRLGSEQIRRVEEAIKKVLSLS